MLQLFVLKPLPHRLKPRLKLRPLHLEGGDIGTLERIDRLLLVAHHEQRPPPGPRTVACGKLCRQQFDHPPLVGAGVLRLVHQNMVDAAVEPEQHPFGDRAVGEQQLGAGDQVVKVEKAALRLACGIQRQEFRREPVQRGGLLRGLKGDAPGPRRLHPPHQRLKLRHQRGEGCLRRLGRKFADLRRKRLSGFFTGQQHRLQPGQQCQAAPVKVQRRQPVRRRLVLGARSGEGGDHRGHQFRLAALQHVFGNRLGGFVRQAKDALRCGIVDGRGKRRPFTRNLFHQRGKILTRVGQRHLGHHPWRAAVSQFLDNLAAQHFCGAVVQFGELRRHPGLQRKAPQQAGAKAVDGLDAQPAGGFDGARKQFSRGGEVAVVRHIAMAKLQQRGAQIGSGHHRPTPQQREQPVLHLGRGGLGIGQAQDMLRLHPVQQQPRHPVGQHPRLARPGIGRQEGRGLRIGGDDLPVKGGMAGHAASSGPTGSGAASSEVCHSPCRDRWS